MSSRQCMIESGIQIKKMSEYRRPDFFPRECGLTKEERKCRKKELWAWAEDRFTSHENQTIGYLDSRGIPVIKWRFRSRISSGGKAPRRKELDATAADSEAPAVAALAAKRQRSK